MKILKSQLHEQAELTVSHNAGKHFNPEETHSARDLIKGSSLTLTGWAYPLRIEPGIYMLRPGPGSETRI